MTAQRQQVPDGRSGNTTKALDYSLSLWQEFTRQPSNLDDSNTSIDNNWVKNQIRPWAIAEGLTRR